MKRIRLSQSDLLAHFVAVSLALAYAWQISQTTYLTTGLQFVAPLLIIMAVHVIWLASTTTLLPGFSRIVFRRCAQSAVGLSCFLLFLSSVMPIPASANVEGVLATVGIIIFCAVLIAAVVAVIAIILYSLSKITTAVLKRLGFLGGSGPKTRLFEFGSIGTVCVVLCIASLEGLPSAYTFTSTNRSVASHYIAASPAQVWQTLETATSPQFPLPSLLSMFPRPTDVIVDEGTSPGAQRKVEFTGREGEGHLTLRVTERTENAAVFDVISDTSPIAGWVAHRKLIYRVHAENEGTRLDVILEFDRLLAPSWFFSPLTKGATYLAMDVLARDVKTRAEG